MLDDKRLATIFRAFASERDWDQFHTPKNLAASLSIESAELLEIFQWSRGQNGWMDLQDSTTRVRVEEELADILLYLIRFADLAGIDLERAAEAKMQMNVAKYPVERFRGSDRKYNE